MRVFWTRGYSATSLDELATATGMNRPSLYAGFGDKHDLYLKTLQRYREQSREATISLLADEPTLREFLTRFYKAAINIYLGGGDDEARGCYSIATASTEATVDPEVREFLADSIRSTDGFLSDLIRNARNAGEIATKADPESLAQLATAVLHTLAVRSRAGVSRRELTALAKSAVDMIVGQ